ncbi:hypothetical protein SERLA73DRAFT_100458 [Serpula lacrymans var. lacrymans S7.3]|uniref:SH3 domain-containing protein n=1 Tax=Serpula lacrymans var. lacrymans (strain S7.3) TaxID=936435 RepID=F8PFB3_SERL3|nr:hypothetical protein SERLA73DRAFT_100458 [Serpula lacrymans var. lacrymans S7.3]
MVRRPHRQDTFDLRDQIVTTTDDHAQLHAHADAASSYGGASDEEHSVLEDDSDGDEREVGYADDDDGSSSLSIPNESIDFDLVYSLHSFAATVEGQANVVKGDSLFLMDDSNSYWWLVRVLKTQEVGYIPAENIETPFERLARLNKHRNVDLAHATPQELQEDVERVRNNLSSRAGSNNPNTPSPTPGNQSNGIDMRTRSSQSKGVAFTPALSVHRYPPAVWNEEDEEEEDVEWDDGAYEDEDPELADEQQQLQQQQQVQNEADGMSMEPDDGMSWDDGVAEDMQARNAQIRKDMQALMTPDAVKSGAGTEKQQNVTQAQMQQQQQEMILAQQRQQQLEQQQIIAQQQQQQQQQQQGQVQQPLRQQTSRERLAPVTDGARQTSPTSPSKAKGIDPAEVTETKKLTVTPSIARDTPSVEPQAQTQSTNGPLLPSAIMQKQEEDRKRTREEIEALEDAARKKVKGKDKAAPAPLVSTTNTKASSMSGGGKLRKERDTDEESRDKEKEKKKKGVFGGLFGRRKDKSKDKMSDRSTEGSNSTDAGRGSEESGRSSNQHSIAPPETVLSPVTASALQQQQQQAILRTSTESKNTIRPQQQQASQPLQTPQTPPQRDPQVSQHASQLRQRDQQQQALYQQYLNRSPASPPEVQPSYGLQSAMAVLPGSASYGTSVSSASGLGLGLPSTRPRPGSLVLSPTAVDGQGVGVPELSVIRVFAGKNLQTEATFKTVLLNTSTTSSDLVRQAIQRFRLPAGEDENDYYLTVKQVEGSSAVLLPAEQPLGVFETLVEAAMELPKVKRSSVGSISSVASNLSMHPAIKKLPMNDFTDDSAVKFYLNRKREDGKDDSFANDEGDETLLADISIDTMDGSKTSSVNISISSGSNVTPERFSSPSYKFALQLVIYPDDLPDNMVFDPLTEAIVFKNTLRDRTQSHSSISSGVSQSLRRKVFVFPKNVTVAEVIELGLERFGILEGVVDGGDEVEDKLTKRRSTSRVRYGLAVDAGGQERELSPSSKVIEGFPRPPIYRAVDRRNQDTKRRSIDSAQLLGSMEDIHPDDPVFILRRSISYRTSSSRHRMSAPLDEIALQHLRESISGSSASSDNPGQEDSTKPRQLSGREIIAAQRAASRANQRAILSAQANSVRGVDIVLHGNAIIRSSRFDSGDRMRYSYVQDGESYDISEIIEREWRDNNNPAHKNDLLEGALSRNKDGLNEKIDRVLSKIKDGRMNAQLVPIQSHSQSDSLDSGGSASSSEYSGDEGALPDARTPTPTAGSLTGMQRVTSPLSMSMSISGSRTPTPNGAASNNIRPRTTTPTSKSGASSSLSNRHPSIASVMSDLSTYATPMAQLTSPTGSPLVEDSIPTTNSTSPKNNLPYLTDDDFGVSHMLTILELGGMPPIIPEPPIHPIDEYLFGRPIDMHNLHPEIRDVYADTCKQLEEMDKTLDEYMQHVINLS